MDDTPRALVAAKLRASKNPKTVLAASIVSKDGQESPIHQFPEPVSVWKAIAVLQGLRDRPGG